MIRLLAERGVARIVIDHPPINLITVDVFVALRDAVRAAEADPAVRAIVLSSANPEWFAAHYDVEAILAMEPLPEAPATLSAFDRLCEQLRTMPKVTIAELDGRVGGGGSEIALACDMRFAGPDAVFNQPEVAIGILPGGGGTARLPRLIGSARAMEMVLGCVDVDAVTAERWGLVNRLLPSGELTGFVTALAERIAGFPDAAVAAAKASVRDADIQVAEHVARETQRFGELLPRPESRRAMQAFLDQGGQTPDGERRLGNLVGELSQRL
ncbi:enoyl-CoA hydratase/isomerase family protein [Desertimonas flava]|uniref:enoyl-CoA hydratase/isomerase family protein n=1 Tax=Desertimonas flava TaxID=2064846 RepID=UPI000E357908|nr:enoyl-CoA hydratase/isomerase family protein [Desertimonas flava]